jgi:hypothetical protein
MCVCREGERDVFYLVTMSFTKVTSDGRLSEVLGEKPVPVPPWPV